MQRSADDWRRKTSESKDTFRLDLPGKKSTGLSGDPHSSREDGMDLRADRNFSGLRRYMISTS